MNDRSDAELIEAYALQHSGAAFAELAARYADLVYTAAMRQVRDRHTAEDVAQAAFIVLAKKAASLRPDVVLGAWLLGVTRLAARDVLKIQSRRRRREQVVAAQRMHEMTSGHPSARGEPRDSEPEKVVLDELLDDAILKLTAASREALVLRFFQDKSFREVGDRLGISEQTARQRVSRAVGKLRQVLIRQGMTDLSTDGLGAILLSTAVRPAPATLTTKVAGAATSGAATVAAEPAALAKGVITLMAYTKTKALLASVLALIVFAGAGATVSHYFLRDRGSAAGLVSSGPPAPFIGRVPGTSRFSWQDPYVADPQSPRPQPKLYAGTPITGSVRAPDGTPIPGATVLLGTEGGTPTLFIGTSEAFAPMQAVSGADGRFELRPTLEPKSLVVVCQQGVGTVPILNADVPADVIVRPWGRVEGVVRVGSRPVARAQVQLVPWYRRHFASMPYHIAVQRAIPTDATGHFSIDLVPPGTIQVRVINSEAVGSNNHSCVVDVQSTATTSVMIGGTGRPVVGRLIPTQDPYAVRTVELSAAPPEPFRNIDYLRLTVSQRRALERQMDQSAEYRAWADAGDRWYRGKVNPDGTFRIEDVPAGTYQLGATADLDDSVSGYSEKVGSAEKQISIPPIPGGRSDDPLDVGQLALKSHQHIDIGDPAPDLAGANRSGKQIRLSDFRGKYVLFSICTTVGDNVWQDMLRARAIHDRFGDDPRLVMLTFHESPWSDGIARAADDARIEWPQLALGDVADDGIPEPYTRSWERMFLIDPQGRLVAKCLNAPRANYAISGPMVAANAVINGLPTILGGLPPLPTGSVKIDVEHVPPGGASGPGIFRRLPPPSADDVATDATFTLVDGIPTAGVHAIDRLHDGKMQPNEDDPHHSFYFEVGTLEGRFKIDLHRTITIAQVNTYSRHKSNRASQVYRLYGSDGTAPEFNAVPQIGTDPARCGWTSIANVDARPATDPPGEYYAVSITNPAGTIGAYRYLLFEIYPATTLEAFSHTFYGEVDVIERK